jgi:hypothetical protein
MINLLLTLPYLLFLLFLIGKIPFIKESGIKTNALQFAFLAKVFCGFLVYLIYAYYYGNRIEADTFKYFDDSYYLYEALYTKPVDFFKMLFGINCEGSYFDHMYYDKMNNWYRAYENSLYNDNRLIIRVNAVLRIFSFGNYHVHSIILNFIAFIGSVGMARFFLHFVKSKWKVYLAVFFIPSVIFWSSGILKESLLLFAMGLFCFFIYRLVLTKNWINLVLLILPFLLLVLLKFYVFVAFFPAILGWYFSETTRFKWKAYLLVFSVLSLIALVLGLLNPSYNFIHILVRKQHDFINMSIAFHVNSAIQMDYLDENIFSIIKAVPMGIINSLTRPWPFEIKNALFIPAIIENFVLLSLILIAIIQKVKNPIRSVNFIAFCFLFTLFLYSIIGISTPILGALVRYKIPAMPFLVIGILSLLNTSNFHFYQSQKIRKWIHMYL